MNKALTGAELEHLLDFVGYGRLDAEVWFVGMEEGGGGEDNIRRRLHFRQVEDCAAGHQILGVTKYHSGEKIIQRTWRGMCYVMLRLEGKEPDKESIRNYQADHLGRFHGSSLLCELMPLPKPNMSSWGYDELIPQFASREEYYQVIKPRRVKQLQLLLSQHRPKTVICYGKHYWQEYQEVFCHLKFTPSDQFSVARDGGMVVILTDHFTARTMNGKLDEVVKLAQNRA